MTTKRCPLCGNLTLEECQGEYHFEPPSNVPGGTMVIPNAVWFCCVHCGEHLIPHALTLAIEAEQRSRLEVPIAVSP